MNKRDLKDVIEAIESIFSEMKKEVDAMSEPLEGEEIEDLENSLEEIRAEIAKLKEDEL